MLLPTLLRMFGRSIIGFGSVFLLMFVVVLWQVLEGRMSMLPGWLGHVLVNMGHCLVVLSSAFRLVSGVGSWVVDLSYLSAAEAW